MLKIFVGRESPTHAGGWEELRWKRGKGNVAGFLSRLPGRVVIVLLVSQEAAITFCPASWARNVQPQQTILLPLESNMGHSIRVCLFDSVPF